MHGTCHRDKAKTKKKATKKNGLCCGAELLAGGLSCWVCRICLISSGCVLNFSSFCFCFFSKSCLLPFFSSSSSPPRQPTPAPVSLFPRGVGLAPPSPQDCHLPLLTVSRGVLLRGFPLHNPTLGGASLSPPLLPQLSPSPFLAGPPGPPRTLQRAAQVEPHIPGGVWAAFGTSAACCVIAA